MSNELLRIHDENNNCDLVAVANPMGNFHMSTYAEMQDGTQKPVDGWYLFSKMIEKLGQGGSNEPQIFDLGSLQLPSVGTGHRMPYSDVEFNYEDIAKAIGYDSTTKTITNKNGAVFKMRVNYPSNPTDPWSYKLNSYPHATISGCSGSDAFWALCPFTDQSNTNDGLPILSLKLSFEHNYIYFDVVKDMTTYL